MWLIVKDEKLWGKTLLVKWSTTWILFTFKLTTITLFGFLCSVHSALLYNTPMHNGKVVVIVVHGQIF